MRTSWGEERVSLKREVDLAAHEGVWPYAENHAEVIDAHWTIACRANPNFFNGTIHVLTRLESDGDTVRGRFMPTEFKTFLYWRDEGFPAEANVRDGFGSALIRSREGHIVLGRQRPGNINEGLAYLPGGFIDPRDVGAGGRIDIGASVARELAEETGLGAEAVRRGEGIVLCEAGVHVSFAIPFVSELTAADLKDRIAAFIAKDPDPELAEALVVRGPDDLKGLAMPHYARVLLRSPLAWQAF